MMSSFNKFWSESKNLPLDSKNGLVTSPSLLSGIQDNIVAATLAPVGIGLALAGFNSSQEEAEKFSKQVAEYATSDEVISAVSDEVGEPKQNETEDEFVERATNVLRNILIKNFKI